jgi:hypothetical protein
MVRVPNTQSIPHLIGGEELVVLPPIKGPAAQQVLDDIDSQVAEIDHRQNKADKR